MLIALLMLIIVLFAFQAIRAERLLHSAIWLASVSALLAVLFYRLGAQQVAVIELSVGAGLVTVLFVFAIGMAGDDQLKLTPLIPKPMAWGMVIAVVFLLGWLILPFAGETTAPQSIEAAIEGPAYGTLAVEEPIQMVIWEQRGLDMLAQVILIFSGVLGLLGLLAEAKAPLHKPVAEEVAAGRERELSALEEQVVQQEKELA